MLFFSHVQSLWNDGLLHGPESPCPAAYPRLSPISRTHYLLYNQGQECDNSLQFPLQSSPKECTATTASFAVFGTLHWWEVYCNLVELESVQASKPARTVSTIFHCFPMDQLLLFRADKVLTMPLSQTSPHCHILIPGNAFPPQNKN